MFKGSTLIPIEYQYDFNNIEKSTLNLIIYYERLYRKYNKTFYHLFSRKKDPRTNPFFKGFQSIIQTSLDKNSLIPDPKLYILAQFEIIKISNVDKVLHCPPYYLFNKKAMKRYQQYIEQLCLEKTSKKKYKPIEAKTIIEELNKTYKFINKILHNKKITLQEFILDYGNWIYISHSLISPYFLSISKTFNSIDKTKIPENFYHEIPENLNIYKELVIQNPACIKIAKDLFKDEVNV